MKYRLILAAAVLLAGLASCQKQGEEAQQKPAAPKVEFSVEQETLNVSVDEAVEFKVTIVEGTNVATAWYVDDEKVSSTPSLVWKFTKVGTTTVHFVASNDLGKVEKNYSVVVAGIPLDVEYSKPEDAFEAVIGDEVMVSITIKGGDKGTVHSWELDGVEASTGLSFSKTFTEEEIGAHTLKYSGVNIDGMTASKTWAITVKDMPLEVVYTPANDAVSAMQGDQVAFSAGIKHGAGGAVYSWKVDGSEVGTASGYTFNCESLGTFAVSVSITNAAGEESTNNWTLTVTEKVALTYMYLDAENLTSVPAFVTGNIVAGNPALGIVDNPLKNEENSGNKVFIDDMSARTSSSSGYVQIMLNQISNEDKAKYTTIRVKVYMGVNQYYPYMRITVGGNQDSLPTKINGSDFYPSAASKANWDSLFKANDWNVLEYDVRTAKYNYPDGTEKTLAPMDQFQFRFMVDYNNNNAITTGATSTNTQIVYFDDVELVE